MKYREKTREKLSTFTRGEEEMGYALFTARKMSLTARVNQMNAQLMSISQKQMDLANQISTKQNASNLRVANANQQAYSVFKQDLEKAYNSGSENSSDIAKTLEATLNETLANNSILTAMSDAEISQLSEQQNILDMQRENLETQLNAAQQELQAVEKAEESAIKNATPGYVG